VVAVGGNALLRRGEAMTDSAQQANIKRAALALAPLIVVGHQIAITHGNGPQVGLLALQGMAGPKESEYPLDVLGAETEGMIGYLIERELQSVLGPGHMVAAPLTQVLVDVCDVAFASPTKPVGPLFDKAEATRLSRVGQEPGGWRRLVPSPDL
jgi:carbamate kinase